MGALTHDPPTHLIAQDFVRIAALDVEFRNDHFERAIDLALTPPELRQLFEQSEEVVEGQMFGLLDDIEARIATASLRVEFADRTRADIADLQVFPSTRSVSFVARQLAAAR